ncbi:MAG: hypothetical protein WBG46_10000 [Nonlabens sp.]
MNGLILPKSPKKMPVIPLSPISKDPKYIEDIIVIAPSSNDLIKSDRGYFVVKAENNVVMEISKTLFDVIKMFEKPQILKKGETTTLSGYILKWNTIEELIEQKFLTTSLRIE